jgi:hypothetical protein
MDLLRLLRLVLLDQLLLLLLSVSVLPVPVSLLLLLLLLLPLLPREFEAAAAVVGASRWPFASISSPRMFVRRRGGGGGALLGGRSTRRRGRCW